MARTTGAVPWVVPKDLYVLTVLALMRGVAVVGSPRLRNVVAHTVAGAAFRLSRRKRQGGEAMVARVFGDRMTPRRRRMVVRRAFEEFWLDAFSMPRLRGRPEAVAESIQGVEHLRRALADGRGAILWISNNFGRMTALKRTLHARGFAVYKVHAAAHLGGFRMPGDPDSRVQQRVIRPFFDAQERPLVAGIVSITPRSLAFVRELTGRLAANGIVCMSGDVPLGRRLVPGTFLGVPERFPTGGVSLARTTGAALLPTFCLRGPRGTSRVVIEPPVDVPADLDREHGVDAVLRRLIARVEHHTTRHPSLYLTWHAVGMSPAATVTP
jgi:KDO2-lipid IV(A) lauroyltransferase